MDERASSLPNLNPGHLEGCRTRAVYSGGEDAPPVLLVATCDEGCPHLSVELERA
jgi:hypothetical protein